MFRIKTMNRNNNFQTYILKTYEFELYSIYIYIQSILMNRKNETPKTMNRNNNFQTYIKNLLI